MLGDILSRIGEALRNLVGGRKALFALIAIVTLVILNYAPGDAVRTETISKLVAVVAGVLIFGITVEDSLSSWAEARATALEELIRILLEALKGTEETPAPTGVVREIPKAFEHILAGRDVLGNYTEQIIKFPSQQPAGDEGKG